MTDDERAIQELVATWMRASERGDVNTVLSLMADDVIFMAGARAVWQRRIPRRFGGNEKCPFDGQQ
jgi:uncharacterized protein (TIGR02246 family)